MFISGFISGHEEGVLEQMVMEEEVLEEEDMVVEEEEIVQLVVDDEMISKSPPLNNLSHTPPLHNPLSNVSETPAGPRRNRPLRHIGDIKTPDLETPRRRRECLSLIRYKYGEIQTENKFLKQKTKRLQERIKTLKDLTTHLQKKNLVSAHASQEMQVSDKYGYTTSS